MLSVEGGSPASMLEFRYPELGDKKEIKPMLSTRGDIASENAFGSLYIWSQILRTKICVYKDTFFSCFGTQSDSYSFPLGGMSLKDSLALILDDSRRKGIPFRMWGMTKSHVDEMERTMPNTFSFELDRAGSDYIYNADDLINLPGRKYQKKRNHLNKFNRAYRFTYEDVTRDNIQDCISVARQWMSDSNDEDGKSVIREGCALIRALDNYEHLELLGGLIRIEGKPVAFSIGEEINDEAFLVHFEKALIGYDGIYAAINQVFAEQHLGKYRFVNRDEDMGVEGLRKAKLSYNPALILEKYSASLKADAQGE